MTQVKIWSASAIQGWRHRHRKVAVAPEAVQTATLRAILRSAIPCDYLRRHHVHTPDIADFLGKVPVSDYRAFSSDIERMLDGESDRLFPGICRRFAETSGTTGPSRAVPLRDLAGRDVVRVRGDRYFDMANFLSQVPEVSYRGLALSADCGRWLVIAGGTPTANSAGVVMGPLSGFGFAEEYAQAPDAYATCPDWFQYAVDSDVRLGAILGLTAGTDVRAISCFAGAALEIPRFLTEKGVELLRLIHDGSSWPELPAVLRTVLPSAPPRPEFARSLERDAARDGGLRPRHLFPQLRLLRTFLGASMRAYASEFEEGYGVPLRDFGLASSEAQYAGYPTGLGVSPFFPAMRTNYYEYISSSGAISPIHELSSGESYRLVVTSGHGLYRYDTGDMVRVVGRWGRTPLFELEGRTNTSDLVGEKLSEADLARALTRCCADVERMLRGVVVIPMPATQERRATYRFFIEATDALPDGLEETLSTALAHENCSYAIHRKELRVSVARVAGGAFRAFRQEQLRLGEIRPSAQEKPRLLWSEGSAAHRWLEEHVGKLARTGECLAPERSDGGGEGWE